MLKKFTAVLLSAFIVVLSIPAIKTNATDVTVEGTFGDITTDYTNDDFLTTVNYDTYYDTVDNGLKYSVNSDVFVNNNDSDYGSRMIETVLGNMSNLNNTEFPDVPGKHIGLYVWWRSTYSVYFYTLVVDGADDLAFVNGYLCSKSNFTIKEYIYSCGSGTFNGTYTRYTGDGFGYNIIDDSANIQFDSTNGIYYRNYGGMCVYSEIPYLFTYVDNSSYTDVNYLGQSPYNYQNWYNVYNAYVNNTDDTGFIVDRRTDKMIDSNSGSSGSEIVSVDYDEDLFEGVLGFNWFNPSATLNYNSHTQLYYPYFMFNYQINNYTNIHKSSCSIVIESSIGLCLRYNLDGSPYQTISHFSNNKTLLLTDFLENFTIYASDQGQGNPWTNTSLRTTRGFNTSTGLNPFEGDLTDDIKTALSQYGTNGNIDYANSYATFKVNFYIRDNVTGNISETYQAIFDMYQNNYKDNKNELVSNDNQEFIDFKNSFDYLQNGDDLTPVNYANDVSGGQGGNSIVTITNPQFPYLLVDIPEGEWMSKTPNLTSILTDFKNALSEVKDNSILNVMSETYNYLPVPVWQYFTYGVGILIAIGIWRAITRR